MKVVRIIARLNVGGPAQHVVWLTAGLHSADYESVLVTGVIAPGEDDMSYFAAAHGVVPLVLPEMSREISLRDARTIWKLYRLFVRLRPDIVHTHTAKAGTVGRIAALLYRFLTPWALLNRARPCRVVHTYHGHVFHSYYGALRTRFFLLIEKLLARIATDLIVVLSDQQFREIHERYGVGRSSQFRIVPLGLDIKAFTADLTARRDIMRRELGAEPPDVLIGIIGRLTEVKNHELFLRAAARYQALRKNAPCAHARRVRFIIIGDGHLRKKLERESEALGLLARHSDVQFLGARRDAENFYPALDVVALSSLNEGTPLTLIEAMANQRPVIATNVGGVIDLLGEKIARESEAHGARYCERGVLVPSNDADAFCEGLHRLIEDEELRRQMGARGRRFVESHYSKDRLLSDIKKLYGELMQQESIAVASSTAAAATARAAKS